MQKHKSHVLLIDSHLCTKDGAVKSLVRIVEKYGEFEEAKTGVIGREWVVRMMIGSVRYGGMMAVGNGWWGPRGSLIIVTYDSSFKEVKFFEWAVKDSRTSFRKGGIWNLIETPFIFFSWRLCSSNWSGLDPEMVFDAISSFFSRRTISVHFWSGTLKFLGPENTACSFIRWGRQVLGDIWIWNVAANVSLLLIARSDRRYHIFIIISIRIFLFW